MSDLTIRAVLGGGPGCGLPGRRDRRPAGETPSRLERTSGSGGWRRAWRLGRRRIVSAEPATELTPGSARRPLRNAGASSSGFQDRWCFWSGNGRELPGWWSMRTVAGRSSREYPCTGDWSAPMPAGPPSRRADRPGRTSGQACCAEAADREPGLLVPAQDFHHGEQRPRESMQYDRRNAFSQPDDGPQPGEVTEGHSGQVDVETSVVPGNTAQRPLSERCPARPQALTCNP